MDFGTLKNPLNGIKRGDDFSDDWNNLKNILPADIRWGIKKQALSYLEKKNIKREKDAKNPIINEFNYFKSKYSLSEDEIEVVKGLYFIEKIEVLHEFYNYLVKKELLKFEFVLSLFCDLDWFDVQSVFETNIVNYLKLENKKYYEDFCSGFNSIPGLR